MTKRIFICNTVFQVMVATWINHKYFKKNESDIIVSNHMNGGEKIAKNMQIYGEFSKVYYAETLNVARGRIPETRLQHAKKEYNPLWGLHQFFDLPVEYEDIFVSNLDGFTQLYFAAACSKNPNVKIHIFEDGLSTYSKLYASWYFAAVRPKYDFLRGIVYDYIYRKKYLKDYVADMWLLTPEFLQWQPDVPVITVEKINPKDKEYLEICNQVFAYYDSVDVYDKKYIFMEECFYTDGIEPPDVELVNRIAERVGKENIMVKIHPRNPVNRFAKLGYKTNVDTGIPWELICMNMADLEERTLVTISSGSILNPIMIFGIPVKAYSLHDIAMQMESTDGFKKIASQTWNYVKQGYDKYYPNIVVCQSLDKIK